MLKFLYLTGFTILAGVWIILGGWAFIELAGGWLG